ncbi:MAG: hypothetical protein ABIT38_02805 [Gemmatimonadaceae bacterium]
MYRRHSQQSPNATREGRTEQSDRPTTYGSDRHLFVISFTRLIPPYRDYVTTGSASHAIACT